MRLSVDFEGNNEQEVSEFLDQVADEIESGFEEGEGWKLERIDNDR